jgi:hypothetical protein
MVFAAVAHIDQWLDLEKLLTLLVELSLICLVCKRRPALSIVEQLILFWETLTRNKVSIICRLE